MKVIIKTDVSVEPVSLEFIKNYIKFDIDNTDESSLISSLITSCREMLERYTSLSFAEKTFILKISSSEFNTNIELPNEPIASILSVKKITYNGTETTLTLNEDYFVTAEKELIINKSITYGNDEQDKVYDDVYQVEYTAGYGTTGNETLPSMVKVAIAKQVAQWYDNRGTETILGSESMRICNSISNNLCP